MFNMHNPRDLPPRRVIDTTKSIAQSGADKETDVFTKLLTLVADDAAPAANPRAPGRPARQPLQVSARPLPCSRHRRLPLRRPAAHASFFRTTH